MEPRADGSLGPVSGAEAPTGGGGRVRRATHRSVELPLPADGQVEVAAQAPDGHHPHVHRLDLQHTWSWNRKVSGVNASVSFAWF